MRHLHDTTNPTTHVWGASKQASPQDPNVRRGKGNDKESQPSDTLPQLVCNSSCRAAQACTTECSQDKDIMHEHSRCCTIPAPETPRVPVGLFRHIGLGHPPSLPAVFTTPPTCPALSHWNLLGLASGDGKTAAISISISINPPQPQPQSVVTSSPITTATTASLGDPGETSEGSHGQSTD